ncbi:MAG: hypothetical protein IPK66_16075 [Rhodospirillales bacterium]|nr:hypothetical protein [Rhodospirillales bacterium]
MNRSAAVGDRGETVGSPSAQKGKTSTSAGLPARIERAVQMRGHRITILIEVARTTRSHQELSSNAKVLTCASGGDDRRLNQLGEARLECVPIHAIVVAFAIWKIGKGKPGDQRDSGVNEFRLASGRLAAGHLTLQTVCSIRSVSARLASGHSGPRTVKGEIAIGKPTESSGLTPSNSPE